MKILVVGGNGFIGSKIVEMLSNEKHNVRVMDNSETYGVIAKENLKKLNKFISLQRSTWQKAVFFIFHTEHQR